jgi:CHAD domain-containing protein
MAAVIPLPAKSAEAKGLLYWMERSLKERERVLASPDEEAVHALRVALRRCRSLASVFEEVDPHHAWRDLRKTSRKLFRSLGAIRDSQVQEGWVLKLAGTDDTLRTQILYAVKAGRDRQERDAKKSAAKFDEKAWAKLARALKPRLKLIPVDGPAAQCLALERLEEAAELHRRALRTEKSKPWHELRIGIKHFRYTVENLLPDQHASWSSDIKRLQDLLGDVHDLDVLLDTIQAAATESPALDYWKETIARERTERIETYRQLTLGTTSLWNQWRSGLPTNGQVAEAVQARLLATARAADPRRAKSSGTARLAKRLFKELKRSAVSPIFKDGKLEVLATAASLLHGIDPEHHGKEAHKDARKFLSELPTPPGWTGDDWRLLTLVIRYHRGAAPSAERGRFSKLAAAQQTRLLLLAGILRVARTLRKNAIQTAARISFETKPDSISILLEGFSEAQSAPKALVVGKHLLESALGKTIIFRALEKLGPMLPLEFPSPPAKTLAAGAG